MTDERVVKLRSYSGCAIKLSLSPNFNLFLLDQQDRDFIGTLTDLIQRYESSALTASKDPAQELAAKQKGTPK